MFKRGESFKMSSYLSSYFFSIYKKIFGTAGLKNYSNSDKVAHACNPSNSRGRDWENCGLRSAEAKKSVKIQLSL
jgi:hypothetical protein